MERTRDLATPIAASPDWDELRRALAAQQQVLAEQTQMLRALDARREALDDLVNDMMPVANDALLLAIGKLDAFSRSDARAQLNDAARALDAVRRSPAPGWGELFRRLRAPEVRKGLALLLTTMGLLGKATTPRAPEPRR
jgi:uncharacterized protein YjgD (DUF1641 family)